MLDKIEFGARDPELVDLYYKTKETEKPETKNSKIVIASACTRVNGMTICNTGYQFSFDKDSRISYRDLKSLFLQVLHLEEECQYGLPDYKWEAPLQTHLVPDNDFWKEVSNSHYEIDGHKFPKDEDVHKYDIDVSLLVNGALVYHGWQLLGTVNPLSFNDAQEMALLLVMNGMSEDTNEPSVEKMNSLPW